MNTAWAYNLARTVSSLEKMGYEVISGVGYLLDRLGRLLYDLTACTIDQFMISDLSPHMGKG